jgi:hypothetical protein
VSHPYDSEDQFRSGRATVETARLSGRSADVNTMNPRREAMVHASVRRFVKVAPPTVHAGVGNALRQAFAMDGETRSLEMFEDLLTRLDQTD